MKLRECPTTGWDGIIILSYNKVGKNKGKRGYAFYDIARLLWTL